jgi:hypothetical protein
MFAMRDPESEDIMLLFVEDHFETWPKGHAKSINECYPELAKKYGEEHAFPGPKVSFYAPDPRKGCEHEWEGTNEINVKTMAAGPDLIAELKKLYAREDELLDALRIIRDDLNELIDKGHVTVHTTNGNEVKKIRNFANDASQ